MYFLWFFLFFLLFGIVFIEINFKFVLNKLFLFIRMTLHNIIILKIEILKIYELSKLLRINAKIANMKEMK